MPTLQSATPSPRTADDTLRRAELFHFLTEETDLLIYDYDVNSGRIAWQGPVAQVLGYPPEQFAQMDVARWIALIHPDDRAATVKTHEQALADGGRYTAAYRFQHRAGHYVPIHDRGIVLLGAAPRLVGAIFDASAGPPPGLLLRMLLARTAAATGMDFLQTLVREGGLLLGCQRVGIARKLPGQPQALHTVAAWQRDGRVPPADFPIRNSPARLALEQGYFETSGDLATDFPQWAALDREGTIASYAAVALKTSTGQTLGLFWVMFGPEAKPPASLAAILRLFAVRASAELERLQCEQELTTSHAHYHQVIDGLPEGVLVARDDRVLFANRAATRLLGYAAPAELLHTPTSAHIPSGVLAALDETIRLFAAGQIEPCTRETTLRRRDGSEFEVDLVVARVEFEGQPALQFVLHDITKRRRLERAFEAVRHVLPDGAGGQIDGYVGTVDDISELAQANEEIRRLNAELERRVTERTTQLAAANAELEAFSYSVSHDLRSPLRALDGFSRALEEDFVERLDETGCGYLRRIRAASQHMGRLIDDLLLLSRASRVEMRREPLDLSALAAEIDAELRAHHPGRTVEFACAPGLHAAADRALARIVLYNLLDNAWKYTRRQPVARIELAEHPAPADCPAPVLVVRDNGAGFDMRHAGKLFAPFQRLHAPADFEGTGIGLATVKRIVARHGGRVWAEATVARGANFYFTFGGISA